MLHRKILKKASCAPNSACCFSGSVGWPDECDGLSLQAPSASDPRSFFGRWFLISNQKARARPLLQQHEAEFKVVGY